MDPGRFGRALTFRYCHAGWPRDLECVNLEIGVWLRDRSNWFLVRGSNVGSARDSAPDSGLEEIGYNRDTTASVVS